MIESDPYITIEEAMKLTGWSRKELLQRICRAEVKIKFGASRSPHKIRNCTDHPAYQLAGRIIRECMEWLETPEFKARMAAHIVSEEDNQCWERLTEASLLQAAVIRVFDEQRRDSQRKKKK